MPSKRKMKRLKTYPSIAHMIADTQPPRFAMKFFADTIQTLQSKVRVLELKAALLGADVKSGAAVPPMIFRLGDPGKGKKPTAGELMRIRGMVMRMSNADLERVEKAIFGHTHEPRDPKPKKKQRRPRG